MCLPIEQGKTEDFFHKRPRRRLQFGRGAGDGVFVEDGVHYRRSAVRRVDDVDLAVMGLNGIGIGEGVVAARNIAPMGIGLIAVR